jgi:hypothetical protein
MELPVEHGLLLDNLLDLAHAPFTHTSTFAKGWSVPRYFYTLDGIKLNWLIFREKKVDLADEYSVSVTMVILPLCKSTC